jgi:hypothetical protein
MPLAPTRIPRTTETYKDWTTEQLQASAVKEVNYAYSQGCIDMLFLLRTSLFVRTKKQKPITLDWLTTVLEEYYQQTQAVVEELGPEAKERINDGVQMLVADLTRQGILHPESMRCNCASCRTTTEVSGENRKGKSHLNCNVH